MADDISQSSPEFLFGQILSKLDALEKGAAELTNAVKNLPETNPTCQQRVGRLEIIETWKGTIEKDNRFRAQAGLKLWHGVVLVAATALAQSAMTLLLLWAQR